MPAYSLVPFDKKEAPPLTIFSELNFNDESIFISYKMKGDLSLIDLGKGNPKHKRALLLWEKTCFELFIKNDKDSYMEFNFSCEFEWNTFYFEKKGDPLIQYEKMDTPKIDILLSSDFFLLIAEIPKNKFPPLFLEGKLAVNITSVIKMNNGPLSYWALAHKDTKPNFHDFSSFKYMF